MTTPRQPIKGAEKILLALAEFAYLTAEQVTRVCYSPGSLAYVRKQLKSLVAARLVVPLAGRSVTMPRVYTLSAKGYTAATLLGRPQARRVRPSEESGKAQNLFFLQHTIAVTDILIGARLLAQAVPEIVLTRLFTERALKRKIYVHLPERTELRQICLEPDASCEFAITETWHETPQTWEDFFHIEVYRTLPPVEWRFKQKIQGYVTYATTGQHAALFHTPALSIAVFAATREMAATLKRWTEQALEEMHQPEQGERFFFRSIADLGTVTPSELYLAPVWEQPFGNTKTPLLILE
jgi:hypothetical protein